MIKQNITKFLLLLIAFTFALSANYLFAAWVGPTEVPPGGNTPTPIHVGVTDQTKTGGLLSVFDLWVDSSIGVTGGGYFQGNVGVGVAIPTESLEVAGDIKTTEGIKIGNTADTEAGTIRWTGTDFEGYTGTEWKSLTAEGGTTISSNVSECTNLGGSWMAADELCYISGTSCPSGWEAKEGYSSTQSNSCVGQSCTSSFGQVKIGGSCNTGGHQRQNIAEIESCRYINYSGWIDSEEHIYCDRDNDGTCYATQTEVGCIKQ